MTDRAAVPAVSAAPPHRATHVLRAREGQTPAVLNARSLTESYLRNLRDAEPLAVLEALAAVQAHMTWLMAPHVHAARTRGDSWDTIGAALGTSRQGAWNRFNDTTADPPVLF